MLTPRNPHRAPPAPPAPHGLRQFHQHTDGATAADFPFGWSQLNSAGAVHLYNSPPYNNTGACQPAAQGEGELCEWAAGWESIRLAETSTLALPQTFQAVIVDTPVASGSVHSPFKQAAGQRLARGALAVAYVDRLAHAVDPVATGAALSADGASLVVSVGGVGDLGLDVKVGAEGFEVLGNCSATQLCWKSCKISGSGSGSGSVTVGGLPAAVRAVRYLWGSSPCGSNSPYQCPVYAKVKPLGALSGEDHPLPLGPFIMEVV